MHPNAETIHEFYRALARHDAAGMVACYHEDVSFCDPAFGELDAKHVRGMWNMLCTRGKDLTVEHSAVEADGVQGRAHWEARYTFTGTGRKVHNVIDARFRFADGKILRHDDQFDFWRWTRMALGPMGTLLGWTPFVQGSVRTKARAQLEKWLAEHP